MSYDGVARAIKGTTLATVGVDVSPHLFRTSAASTAATRSGDNPHLGSAILNHTDVRVKDEHYNRATSFSATESLRQLIRQHQKNAKASTSSA